MFTKMSLSRSAMLGIAALAGLALTAPPAHAGFIATVQQVGSNVVISGSGTINTSALLSSGFGVSSAGVFPVPGIISFSGGGIAFFFGFTGPFGFGTGSSVGASSSIGDAVGLDGSTAGLWVPAAYASGSPLSTSDTFDNTTIAGLGITPGTYIWTWGSGPTADFFEITTAPEPTSVLLVGSALLGLLALRRCIAR